MKYKNILLTGGSGNLGREILNSGLFPNILAPSSKILNITNKNLVKKFFENNSLDAVIHCAAVARMSECEKNPIGAIKTNIIGTCNLVNELIRVRMENKRDVRFIHISTDGVYNGVKGNYSENDATIPYNKYGWSKLGAECAVNLLPNFVVVRTSFFNPLNIKYKFSPIDSYSSKMPIKNLVKVIYKILNIHFVGTINIGNGRKSDYERYKEFKSSLKPCKFKEILKAVNFYMGQDASLDCTLWKKIQKQSQ